MVTLLVVLTVALVVPAMAAAPAFVRDPEPVALKSPRVAEASGVAVSPTRAGRLWIINDSGSAAELHRTGTDGADLGKVAVSGVKNTDWEDLSSFLLDGKPYLMIADTGDNAARRKECRLHVVAEPQDTAKEAPVAWTIRFTYEDGPRDCESVAVDETAGKILLLSKRTTPPVLYELPLKPAGREPLVARKIGPLGDPLATGGLPVPYGTQPTGLDVRADGTLAVVTTYARVFVFSRGEGESWGTALGRPAVALAPHRLNQAEAVCFSRDGGELFAVSEGGKSPVVRYRKQ
jgi:hypothetical protein